MFMRMELMIYPSGRASGRVREASGNLDCKAKAAKAGVPRERLLVGLVRRNVQLVELAVRGDSVQGLPGDLRVSGFPKLGR
jgi:hypothetical protein